MILICSQKKSDLELRLLVTFKLRSRGRQMTVTAVWPGAAIRVVAAPQVVYLSARLGFTLRDDGQNTITYVMKP